MRIIILFILSILIIGCSKDKSGRVELEIVNNEIYYSGSDRYLYSSQEHRINSRNVITYKFINNTEENIVLFINRDILHP